MKLRELLNEYELDWTERAYEIHKKNLSKLARKRILLVGKEDDFARAVLYCFLSLNENENLNMQIGFLNLNPGEKNLYSAFEERGDFELCTPETCKRADYVIYTGACNQKITDTADCVNYLAWSNLAYRVAQRAEAKKVILFSDYRAYGNTDTDFEFSEYEQGMGSMSFAQKRETDILRSVEALGAAYAKESEFELVILRSAILLGAFIETENPFAERLLEQIRQKNAVQITRSTKKASYVYITDVLSAMLYCMVKRPKGKVFNVAGREATVSDTELAEYVYRNFSDQVSIEITAHKENGEEQRKISLNMDRLELDGWYPLITLEDALCLKIKSMISPESVFIFDNTYKGKLSTVHNILLAYLLEVDRICRKHHIKYFLAGGTLLGAIRHGGFIPWDDDADVMMLREDYDHFCRIVQSELPSNLFFQIPETEEKNHGVFAKIRIDNTIFATKFTATLLDMHNGVFFDVLCHDKTANSRLGQKLHVLLTLVSRSLVFHKWGKTPIWAKGKYTLAGKLATGLKNIIPMPVLEWCQKKALLWFDKRKNARYLYDGMGRNIRRGAFPKEWLDEAVYVDFEGCQFPVPKEYDKYLTYLYGDYMKMIPVSCRRTSHEIKLMDLGEYMGFRME